LTIGAVSRAGALALSVAALCLAWPLVPTAQRAGAGGSSSAPRTSYVRLGGRGQGTSDAVLYEPGTGAPKNGIALMFGHPSESNFNHPSGRELARRGYRILMVNVQDGRSMSDSYAPAYSAAIKYLRALPGVEKVVIVTHSGGGHEMAFYQNVAENGSKACSGPEKVYPCRPELTTGLEKADGLVLLDSTLGAFHQMSSIDPAVDSTAPHRRKPELDMFDARNGYDGEKRRASYTPEFSRRFYAAQAARSAALVDQARARLAAIEKGESDYSDDEPFVVPGMGVNATGARLYQPDVRVVSKTHAPHLLLKADGTTPIEIIHSVRPPSGANPDEALRSLSAMTQNSTVRRFLGMSAIRTRQDFAFTEDDIVGVDWKSAMSSTPANAEGITVPTLVMSMTCHYLLVPGEIVFNHLAARDKQFALVEGATHNFTACRPEYGDTVARTFDYVDAWLAQPGRFLRGSATVRNKP
jgi:pimeloyl-ACP methyl ester carboxylesterase